MTEITFLEETMVEAFDIVNNNIYDPEKMLFKENESLTGRFVNDNEDFRIFFITEDQKTFFIIITRDMNISYKEV